MIDAVENFPETLLEFIFDQDGEKKLYRLINHKNYK